MLIGVPGRDNHNAMGDFVSFYELDGIPQIPDNDDHDLWFSFGVRGQPAWVLVRADGSTEVGFGGIPGQVFDAAAGA